MDKEELLKKIMELPKIETNKPISAMNCINIDDLINAVDRFDKVPTYDELLRENKQLQKKLKCTIGIVEHNKIISEKNKEIYELKEQVKKQKEVIDKIFSRITLLKMEDITIETSKCLDELLKILKEVSE